MSGPKPIKYELPSGERAHEAAASLSEIFAGVARVTAVPIHLGQHHIEDWGRGIRHGEGFGLEARSMHQSRTIFQMARVFEDSARREIYVWVQRTSTLPEDREILRRAQHHNIRRIHRLPGIQLRINMLHHIAHMQRIFVKKPTRHTADNPTGHISRNSAKAG